MRYTVTGAMPIATMNGDVQPGQTLEVAGLDPRTNVDALVAAGHLEPADDKPAEKKKPAGGASS